MRVCSDTTRHEIARQSGLPTKPAWLKLALSDARNGKPMSLKRENRMRAALGLDALPEPIPTPPCPDCGEVHNGGRCHGRPVVVVLKTAPKPRRYSRIADMPASMLARAIKQRREYGA